MALDKLSYCPATDSLVITSNHFDESSDLWTIKNARSIVRKTQQQAWVALVERIDYDDRFACIEPSTGWYPAQLASPCCSVFSHQRPRVAPLAMSSAWIADCSEDPGMMPVLQWTILAACPVMIDWTFAQNPQGTRLSLLPYPSPGRTAVPRRDRRPINTVNTQSRTTLTPNDMDYVFSTLNMPAFFVPVGEDLNSSKGPSRHRNYRVEWDAGRVARE